MASFFTPGPGIKLDSPGAGSSPRLTLELVRNLALAAGFTEAGVVPLPHVNEARDADRYEYWIREGRSGSMEYLSRTNERDQLLRARVANSFAWARSAVVCLASYNAREPDSVNAAPRSTDPAPANSGWIARYAWSGRTDSAGNRRPSDYHKVLLKRLKLLDAKLHEQFGQFESRAYVDTGPIAERSLAVAAGLGWTGKNTCLIHPRHGSFAFLAVLLTSLELAPGQQQLKVEDHCGTCTRCIEACPTQALVAPYQMDATRCIAYLTIEHKGSLDPVLMDGMGRQIFGCDICQDVCPWNSPRRTPISVDPDLSARAELINPALEWLASLEEPEFERNFNGSPVRRAGFLGLRRNVAVAMGNSGERRFAATLRRWSEVPSENPAAEALRAAARWALEKLDRLSENSEQPSS
jgi:epoxyqueuosine reductase